MTNYCKVHIFTPEKTLDYLQAPTCRVMEKKQAINIGSQHPNETYLVTLEDHQLIYVANSELRIRIYKVKDDLNDNKFDFFATINEDLIGFMVENMNGFDEFHKALEWYSLHVGQPFFKLFKERP